MNEEKYLEEVRSRSDVFLWLLFITDVAIVFAFNQPENRIWVHTITLATESAMAAVFALRHNWVRAVVFALFSLQSARIIIG